MSDPTVRGPAATRHPVLCEEGGGLSLHFEDGTVQSRMLHADPSRLVLEYTRRMMGFLLLHPAPMRIAMIGLGGGSLAKYAATRLPGADFTAVDVSPEVIALRSAFGIPPDGPRFRVRCQDGAAFVRSEGEALDVLMVDAFDRTGQPAALRGAAFYDDCRTRLAADGVLVVNLYSDDPDFGVCLARIRDAFADRVVVVEADDSANTVVFAGAAPGFPPPFPVLVARLRALAAGHPVDLEGTLRKVVQYRERVGPLRPRPRPRAGTVPATACTAPGRCR